MNKIKFIYFDIGGVVIDFRNVFKAVTSKFNIPYDAFTRIWDDNIVGITKGDIGPQEFWNEVRRIQNIKQGADYDFLDSWISDYKTIQPIYDFIKHNYGKIKIGILSNIYKGMIPRLIEKDYIPDIKYEQIVASCDIGMQKPELNIYEYAQEKTGLKANEILLVDDREDYIEPAKKLGWNMILFDQEKAKISIDILRKLLQ